MPRINKCYNLYRKDLYERAKRTKEYIFSDGTCYAKTIRGAIKTFAENHFGEFVIECGDDSVMVFLH